MRVFRLCKQLCSGTVLSGEGGLVVDGRWHSVGRRIVYAAHSDSPNIVLTRVDPYVFDFRLFNAPKHSRR
jgi:RES domain-containing protein